MANRLNGQGRASLLVSRRALKSGATLLGLGLLVGMIVWAGPAAMWERLRSVDPTYLSATMGVILLGTVLGAINSYLICGAFQVMGFGEYLRAFWVAWAVGLVLPGQAGDMLTLTQILRRRGLPLSLGFARTGVDKVISLLCTLAVASQIFRLGPSAALHTLSIGASLALLGLLCLVLMSFWFVHGLSRFGFQHRWLLAMVSVAGEVARTIRSKPGLVFLNVLLSLIKIVLTGFSYWLIVRGLHITPPSAIKITIAAVSSGLVAYLPLSANGIGTVEAVGSGLFGQIGMATELVLSMYLLLRVANIALAWLPASFLLPTLLRRSGT